PPPSGGSGRAHQPGDRGPATGRPGADREADRGAVAHGPEDRRAPPRAHLPEGRRLVARRGRAVRDAAGPGSLVGCAAGGGDVKTSTSGRRTLALLVGTLALGTVMVPVAASSPAAAAGPDGPFAVGKITKVFVDTTRKTNAGGGCPAEPTRTLSTLILYPG